MTPKPRNTFLDAGDSDGEANQGYDSAAEELTKGGRTAKRRRVESDNSEESGPDQELPTGEEADVETEKLQATERPTKLQRRDGPSPELPGVSKPLTKKNLVASAAAIKRSGVVYLSRIPPFMKPTKLRSLLEPSGALNRIFLTPEDPASHTRRVRNGGNKKRSFVDGWVEFVHKADAKRACELLNAKTIGGKKGSYYHDDVWNLLYLKGFKWNNLTEQIAAENAERASRMRAEISITTKENKEFVQNVERAKMLEGMEAKKAARRRKDDNGHDHAEVGGILAPTSAEDEADSTKKKKEGRSKGERPRHFKQTPVVAASVSRAADQSDQVSRVLSKIF